MGNHHLITFRVGYAGRNFEVRLGRTAAIAAVAVTPRSSSCFSRRESTTSATTCPSSGSSGRCRDRVSEQNLALHNLHAKFEGLVAEVDRLRSMNNRLKSLDPNNNPIGGPASGVGGGRDAGNLRGRPARPAPRPEVRPVEGRTAGGSGRPRHDRRTARQPAAAARKHPERMAGPRGPFLQLRNADLPVHRHARFPPRAGHRRPARGRGGLPPGRGSSSRAGSRRCWGTWSSWTTARDTGRSTPTFPPGRSRRATSWNAAKCWGRWGRPAAPPGRTFITKSASTGSG